MILNNGENLQNLDSIAFGNDPTLPNKGKTDPDYYEAIADAINTKKAQGGISLTTLSANANETYNAPSGTAYNQVTVNVQPNLIGMSAPPAVTQQVISAPSPYDGISTFTIQPIPNKAITLIIPTWATGVSVVYRGTTYTNGSYISMYATESIYINFPASGATITLNGATATLAGTQAVVTLFEDTILNFASASHADIASMAGIGAKVPVQYILRAWEAYAYCVANFSGFSYQDILILNYTDSIVIGLLRSNFAVQSYDDSTGAFTASGWYRCSYAKSTGVWTFSNYASTTSPSGDTLANAVFTDGTLTYSSSTVFPTNKVAGGGGGGPWTITLNNTYAEVIYNGTYYGDGDTITVPDGAMVLITISNSTTGEYLELYLNNVELIDPPVTAYPKYYMLVHSDVTITSSSWSNAYITAT